MLIKGHINSSTSFQIFRGLALLGRSLGSPEHSTWVAVEALVREHFEESVDIPEELESVIVLIKVLKAGRRDENVVKMVSELI